MCRTNYCFRCSHQMSRLLSIFRCFFNSVCTFKYNFDNAKSCFFGAFNALYSKVSHLAPEKAVLSLIRAKYLPILLYATEACPLLHRSRNRHSSEFTITRLFMKLFRTASPAVVKCCQLAFNILPVQSQIDIRTAIFFTKVYCIRERLMLTILINCSSSIK